jgi:phosphatidyl-myo-inositol dimannoside synthase
VQLRLLIITFDPPQNIGGVEGRVKGYVQELTAKGNLVEIEAFAPGYRFTVEGFNGSRLHKCPSSSRRLIQSFRYTVRLITGRSIDSVFLLSGGITVFGNATLLFCRLFGKRTAILLYGKDVLQARKRRLGRALAFVAELLTNRIATNSRYTASLVPSYFGSKVSLLYPGVDGRRAGGDEIRTSPKDGQRILFVGRLVKRKGADDLIRAFTLIASDLPGAQLEIVGDGPERIELEGMVDSLKLGDRVIFFGTLTDDALFERYLGCDAFVMTPRTMKDDVEGFGTVFLEAGLAGKPSVGTFSGGVQEAIVDGETGFLVQEGDVPGLASCIRRILSDPSLGARLGSQARARVLSEFTWAKSADRLEGILGLDSIKQQEK